VKPTRVFADSQGRQNSIAFRLLPHLKFVDILKNSVDPLSNEFDSQVIVISFYFVTIDTLLTPENAIFAVFGRRKGAPAGAPFGDAGAAAHVSRLEKRTVVARAR
jgi:hypothetical protein